MKRKKVKFSKLDLLAKDRLFHSVCKDCDPTIELIMKIVLYKNNENQNNWRKELSYIFWRNNYVHLSDNSKFRKTSYLPLFEAYVESEQDYVFTINHSYKDLVYEGFPFVDIDKLTPQIPTLYNNFLALKNEVLQVFTHKSKIDYTPYEFREIVDKYL